MIKDKHSPIGIFDSGIGGITILCEVVKMLPCEDIIYISDDKNCPYGTKSNQQIISFAQQITERLISEGVKIIVVACNTATMASIKYLREQYDISFVAIEPAIKPASSATETGVVGVIATKSSIESNQLKTLCQKYASDKIVVALAGVGLVDLVETNRHESREAYELLSQYITPMLDKGIDHLVLGCTHYPFFKKNLTELTRKNSVKLVNPAPSIAKQLKKILESEDILNDNPRNGVVTFYSTYEQGVSTRIRERFVQYCEIENTEY